MCETVWLGTAAAARHLGLTPRALYRLVNDGLVPAYRFGRVFRYKRSDLNEFIEAARVRPGEIGLAAQA